MQFVNLCHTENSESHDIKLVFDGINSVIQSAKAKRSLSIKRGDSFEITLSDLHATSGKDIRLNSPFLTYKVIFN